MEKYRFKKKFRFKKMNHVAFQDAFGEEELQDFKDTVLDEMRNSSRIKRLEKTLKLHFKRNRV